MINEPVLILLSGGQDSATCLFWAIREYGREQVRAIGFAYGQRHAAELKLAAALCEGEKIPFSVLDLSLLGQLAPNALTRTEQTVDGTDYNGEYPNTFVDGRNLLFLSFAAIYAKQRGIRDIVIGVSQTDYSGYPDCRDGFIKSLNVTLNLAMEYEFRLITPLMWKNKAQTWAMADELGCLDAVKSQTLTCYNGVAGDGCGECPACALRKAGWEEYLREKGNK